MRAYREALNWMYADDEAIRIYAEWVGISEQVARRTRDEFFPKENQKTDTISDIDLAMQDAVAYKFLNAPLTEAELAQLIKIPRG